MAVNNPSADQEDSKVGKKSAPDDNGETADQRRDSDSEFAGKEREDGKRELTEDDCYDKLGYSFP